MFDVSGSLKEKDKKAAKKWIREIRSKFPNAKQIQKLYIDPQKLYYKITKLNFSAGQSTPSCLH